ncbi:hypothetical protein LSTR_LSTR006168 [Laodelphax striatellus]|uniref:Uncharacterized protein n=1 Tax=Laodelphax striatellus TaxID=195883 RepID=A0A482XTF1_LAOST|nr:hypothetical protein LSTR_LSTR006168 [Laodelphax striatellus]
MAVSVSGLNRFMGGTETRITSRGSPARDCTLITWTDQHNYYSLPLPGAPLLYQKRLKKERKARRRLQDQLELEMKRRAQLEEALKASGAPPEALRILSDFLTPESTGSTTDQPAQTQSGGGGSSQTTGGSASGGGTATGGSTNSGANTGGGSGTGGGNGGGSAGGGSRVSQGSDSSDSPASYASQRPPGATPTSAPEDNKQQWNYSGLDLINSGAAFWQNYSESRAGYYKNSVLFSSAT